LTIKTGEQAGKGRIVPPRQKWRKRNGKVIEIMRTNDAVGLSFAQSLLKDQGIHCMIADQSMSILEGSIGLLPRRLLVDSERVEEARTLLRDAGLGAELK
jgi:hypothetical protein